MTGLTKLTAEELLRRVIFEDDSDAVNETALRLERLEKCEALNKYARHREDCKWGPCTCGYDAARAVLEEPASSCHEPYKSGIKTTCHKCGAYPVEQARAALEGE